MSLEESRKRLLENGITQETVDRLLAAMQVGHLVDRFLEATILETHRDDGWRARRRLKKSMRDDGARFWEHLKSCRPCRLATAAVGNQFLIFMARLDKTAPE